MIYKAEDIRAIHLEVTSRCNAACPMCMRNVQGGKDIDSLPLSDLSLEDIQTIMPPEFVAQLHRLYMCGNYGDPIASKDTLKIYEYLRSHNDKLRLGMNTNGSARNPAWWSELGTIMGHHGWVTFSVDGLADTNHLYRRGTNFEKIMENAAAFIAAGGNANWDYIVFRHNEHQVEEARALADKMGFKKFTVKKTGRFFNPNDPSNSTHEVWDRDGNVEYLLEMPNNPEYRNSAVDSSSALIARYGSMDAYYDAAEIDCKVAGERSIFVTADGYIFPCCWTAPLYNRHPGKNQIASLLDQMGGTDLINAKKRPLKEIVEGPFFQAVEDSWSQPSCAAGKIKICSRTCGKEFDRFAAQFKA